MIELRGIQDVSISGSTQIHWVDVPVVILYPDQILYFEGLPPTPVDECPARTKIVMAWGHRLFVKESYEEVKKLIEETRK